MRKIRTNTISNRETWHVVFWIHLEEMRRPIWKPRTLELLQSNPADGMQALARELELSFIKRQPKLPDCLFRGLLFEAMGRVRWMEAAQELWSECAAETHPAVGDPGNAETIRSDEVARKPEH
jgi:hypothetical protein